MEWEREECSGEGGVLGRGRSAREREGAGEGVLGRGKGEMSVES